MATMSSSSTAKLVILFTIFSSLFFIYVSSFEFQVGDETGWAVPPKNDSKIYNDWASEKRFKVGDSVRFKYKKDSVMEVSETGYRTCNSKRPSYFSNTGNTVYKLDHPGFFYFISGANGHCQRGQRMIVKVMYHDGESSSSDGTNSSASSGGAAAALSLGVTKLVGVLLYLASYDLNLF